MEEQEFKKLKMRLDELETMLKKLNGQEKGSAYYVNIEHAEFQGPIVDQLDYNFDKLDVKEVSGALNLGNNFGVRVGKVTKKEGGSGTEKTEMTSKSKFTSIQKKKTSGKSEPSSKEKEKEETKKKEANKEEKGTSQKQEESSAPSWAGTEPTPGPHTSAKGHAGTASAGGASTTGKHVTAIGGRTNSQEEEDRGETTQNTKVFSQSPLNLGKKIPPGALAVEEKTSSIEEQSPIEERQKNAQPSEGPSPKEKEARYEQSSNESQTATPTYETRRTPISLNDPSINRQTPKKQMNGQPEPISIKKLPHSIEGAEVEKGVYRTRTGLSFKRTE